MKIAICDDSKAEIETITRCINRLKEYSFTADIFMSPGDLLSSRKEKNYDIYILDIEMPEMNGLQLAKEIRQDDSNALFVFLTSHAEYMRHVFEVITFDFIDKPITEERLEQLIKKAVEYLQKTSKHFIFSYRKNNQSLSFSQILYIEKCGRKAIIHTMEQNYQTNMTLSEIWEQLDENAFVNIHASFIINLWHLVSTENEEAKLTGGECLHISKGYRKNLTQKHLAFVKGGM